MFEEFQRTLWHSAALYDGKVKPMFQVQGDLQVCVIENEIAHCAIAENMLMFRVSSMLWVQCTFNLRKKLTVDSKLCKPFAGKTSKIVAGFAFIIQCLMMNKKTQPATLANDVRVPIVKKGVK